MKEVIQFDAGKASKEAFYSHTEMGKLVIWLRVE